MYENGLELQNVASYVEPPRNPLQLPTIQELTGMVVEHFNDEFAYLVAYLDYTVLIGYYESQKLVTAESFKPQYIQKIRIFNLNKELYLWRREANQFFYRVRVDSENGEQAVVDACQALWGTKKVENTTKGWNVITEDRGTTLTVPESIPLGIQDNVPLLWLKTRNYIGYNLNHQAEYIDCRFVDFTSNPDCGGN